MASTENVSVITLVGYPSSIRPRSSERHAAATGPARQTHRRPRLPEPRTISTRPSNTATAVTSSVSLDLVPVVIGSLAIKTTDARPGPPNLFRRWSATAYRPTPSIVPARRRR